MISVFCICLFSLMFLLVFSTFLFLCFYVYFSFLAFFIYREIYFGSRFHLLSLRRILDDLMSRPFLLEQVLSAQIATDIEPCMNQLKFKQLRNSAYVQCSQLNPAEADLLSLCAWNCHLATSYEDVLQFLSDSQGKVSFISICESFLSQEHSVSLYSFQDYNLEIKNRTSLYRRGIACLISKSLTHHVRNDIDVWIEGKFESFSLDLDMGSSKFLLVLCIDHKVLARKNLNMGLINLRVRCLGQV